jgi:hypothetical protein
MRKEGINSQPMITALFWELSSLASAIEALLRTGVSDADIEAIGLLSGQAFDFTGFLHSVGLPRLDATYYSDCLQDGGLLLIIRTQQRKRDTAAEVVCRHGGMLPPIRQWPAA